MLLRLMDDEKQVDFHIVFKPRCLLPQPGCTKSFNTYDIIGDENIYLLIKNSSSIVVEQLKNEVNDNTRAEIQYIRDQLTDNENNLARLTHNIQCDIRKIVHNQAVSTAQYNGWLAASQLRLPRCTKLTAIGQSVLVTKCVPTKVTFNAEITACGPQPRFQNSTVNLDGWELVDYSTCYWTTGFVNFNNKPYAFRNGKWEPIEATIIIPTKDLADSFRYEDVKHLDYKHQINPAYSKTLTSHMNIIADIAAAIQENTARNFTRLQYSKTKDVLTSTADRIGITTFST